MARPGNDKVEPVALLDCAVLRLAPDRNTSARLTSMRQPRSSDRLAKFRIWDDLSPLSLRDSITDKHLTASPSDSGISGRKAREGWDFNNARVWSGANRGVIGRGIFRTENWLTNGPRRFPTVSPRKR